MHKWAANSSDVCIFIYQVNVPEYSVDVAISQAD